MKRLMLVLAVGAATLAGCDEPRHEETQTAPPPVEAAPPPPQPVEEPKPEPVTPTPAPSTVSALPPDERTSAETVKPESETLFY